ncbi:MAG TPA: hypothetical protein VD967_02960 [Candidatus Paceibacterota bacterium]|nr:hypothetical protein [Candidatus Paceibacterota bacterium]
MQKFLSLCALLLLAACSNTTFHNHFAEKTGERPDFAVVAPAEDKLAYTIPAQAACPPSRQFLASEESEDLNRILEAIAERAAEAGNDTRTGSDILGYSVDLETLFEEALQNGGDVLITARPVCKDEGDQKQVLLTTLFERQDDGPGIRSVTFKWPKRGFPAWEAKIQ